MRDRVFETSVKFIGENRFKIGSKISLKAIEHYNSHLKKTQAKDSSIFGGFSAFFEKIARGNASAQSVLVLVPMRKEEIR